MAFLNAVWHTLVLLYGVIGYVMFWRAVIRMEPKSRLPTWIKLAGIMTALLFGPLLILYTVIRALSNPRYWPTDVVFIEIEYDPTTGQLSNQGEYVMTWQSQADLEARAGALMH